MSRLSDRDVQAINAAKLHYLSGLSQGEVAVRLGVSRPTANKLIQHAKDRGWVTISVTDPRDGDRKLADELAARYALASVTLAHAPDEDNAELLRHLGMAGARVVTDHVQDGSVVGVVWGRTLHAVARALPRAETHGVEIVQLKGGMSPSGRTTDDVETMHLFCRAFDAWGRYLPLPAIFDDVTVKDLVERERHVRSVLDRARSLDAAVFTAGAVDEAAPLFGLGYLTDAEKTALRGRAVGDVCSRFLTAQGEIALPELDARTVGIHLEDLARTPHRILIAGGARKAPAMAAALRAGLVTDLVVDDATGRRLLAAPA